MDECAYSYVESHTKIITAYRLHISHNLPWKKYIQRKCVLPKIKAFESK